MSQPMANQIKSFRDKMVQQEKAELVMANLNKHIRQVETRKASHQKESDRSIKQHS